MGKASSEDGISRENKIEGNLKKSKQKKPRRGKKEVKRVPADLAGGTHEWYFRLESPTHTWSGSLQVEKVPFQQRGGAGENRAENITRSSGLD
jgi:hypothetical protein